MRLMVVPFMRTPSPVMSNAECRRRADERQVDVFEARADDLERRRGSCPSRATSAATTSPGSLGALLVDCTPSSRQRTTGIAGIRAADLIDRGRSR